MHGTGQVVPDPDLLMAVARREGEMRRGAGMRSITIILIPGTVDGAFAVIMGNPGLSRMHSKILRVEGRLRSSSSLGLAVRDGPVIVMGTVR